MATELTPIITYMTLDLAATNNFDFVKAVQGDNETRYIYITLLNDSMPYELNCESIVLRGTKPDGTGVFNYCTLSENGEVIVELTGQLLAVSGIGKYEIALYGQAEVNEEVDALTTFPFRIVVDKANIDAEVIASTNEFQAITEIMGNAETLKKSLDTIQEAKESTLQSKEAAASSAGNAAASAGNASISETNAKGSEQASKTSETNAAASASNASANAAAAANKANDAAQSADTAARKAAEASNYAAEAESYAHGGTGTRPGENTDSAEYYYQQAKSISESFSGALRPMGTVTFANLPALATAVEGDMYNVSDQFTTTASFKEGSGNIIPAGANIYKTADGYWDVLAGSPVTGVKGDAETTYHRGNVNLTPDGIGALSITGDSKDNTTTFTAAATRSNIASGEKHSTIFGKIAKFFADMKTVAFTGSYSDLTNKPTIPAAVAVKGNAESSYRTGNVNLTADNIGALPKDGTAATATRAAYVGSNTSNNGLSVRNYTGTPSVPGTIFLQEDFNNTCVNVGIDGLGSTGVNKALIAAKLATARTIALTGSVTGSGKFDGSGNLSITTTTNHTHSYLPLSGGTCTGAVAINAALSTNTSFAAYNTARIYVSSSSSLASGCGYMYASGNNTYLVANNTASVSYLQLKAKTYIQCLTTDSDNTWLTIKAASFSTQSSRRYKDNIASMTDDEAKKLLAVQTVSFDYKDKVMADETHRFGQHGVIAEEVEKIIPEVVSYAQIEGLGNVPDAVDYAKFVPYLIKLAQLQQNEMNELKSRLENLETN